MKQTDLNSWKNASWNTESGIEPQSQISVKHKTEDEEKSLSFPTNSWSSSSLLHSERTLERNIPGRCTSAPARFPLQRCWEEPFCRICHDGKASGELLSPCQCCGSLAMVHRPCLEHWLTASNSSHCELCCHQFALERLPKPLSEWLCSPAVQQQRRTLCGDAVCFLFITPLASLSGWLCVQGASDLYYTNGMEALGLLVLTLVLFTIYIFWTLVSVRYHRNVFQTWKKTNKKVRLQIPLPAHSTPTQHTLSINTFCKGTNKETMV